MEFLKNTILFIVVVVLTHFCATYFGVLYEYFFPSVSNMELGWIGTAISDTYFNGIIISYVFFLISLFTAFGYGGKFRYVWVVILLFPAVLLLIQLHTSQFLLSVVVVLVGFIIGLLLNKKVIPYFKKGEPLN